MPALRKLQVSEQLRSPGRDVQAAAGREGAMDRDQEEGG